MAFAARDIDSSTAPGSSTVSDADQAGWVIITSSVFLIFSFLALGAKLLIAHFRPTSSTFKGYNALLIVATLLALVQTVCIISACRNGLGQYRTAVGDSSFDLVLKYFFSASILVVVSEACSKISVVLFLLALSPHKPIINLCRLTNTIIVAWAVTSVVALAVQCRLPDPSISSSGRCLDLKALYLYIAVVNIMTDVALVVIPIYLMFLTQSEARYQVIALFSTRLVVPGFVIAFYLALSSSISSGFSDPTRDLILPTIWAQISLNLSIITACIPGLKRVLDALRSDAAAVSIAPPYRLSVSQNRYSIWLDSPILSFKSWLRKRSSREERHRPADNRPPSMELQDTQLESRRHRSRTRRSGARTDSLSRVGTAEWGGSSTCLTPGEAGECWTDYRARVITYESSSDVDSRNDGTVKGSMS